MKCNFCEKEAAPGGKTCCPHFTTCVCIVANCTLPVAKREDVFCTEHLAHYYESVFVRIEDYLASLVEEQG